MAGLPTPRITGRGFAFADPALLHQVVDNLALNAWQAGAKVVEIHIDGAEMMVWDDGPGVDEDKREEIFKPFVTSKVRGTGLGLPNAQRFVEAMGGTLSLDTSPHGGAGFRITLMPGQRED